VDAGDERSEGGKSPLGPSAEREKMGATGLEPVTPSL
jgi:hypothetical protein